MNIVAQEIAVEWKDNTSEQAEIDSIISEMKTNGYRLIWVNPDFEYKATILRFAKA